jgi:membrane-associated phospholipid phosphatase
MATMLREPRPYARQVTDTLRSPVADGELSPWQRVPAESRPRRRQLLLGTAVAFAAVSAVFGFPTGREVVIGWVLLLLYGIVAADATAWRRAVLHDWGPFLGVLFVYDLLRGLSDGLAGRAYVLPQLRADEWLFGGTVPTVWLQQHLYSPDPHWYDFIVVPVYMSHFVVPLAVAVALWARSYAQFRLYIWAFSILTVLALVTFAAFPAAPPWLAAQQGLLPFVERVPSHTLATSGIPSIHSAITRGEAYANPVAAMPSLHAAVPLLVLLLSWGRARVTGRTLLSVYVLAMAFTLVYGGEHYVVDILAGWLYAVVAVLLARAVVRRRSRHASA